MRGNPEPVLAGKRGEDAVRASFDIGDKALIRAPSGKSRIPGGVNYKAGTLSEVKNVKSLSLTKQLRDELDIAQDAGLRFDVFVRGGPDATALSRPLRELAEGPQKLINPCPIPGTGPFVLR